MTPIWKMARIPGIIPYLLDKWWRFQQTKMFSTAQFPNPVIPTNISDADATTNLCKSVKSVSFYFSRHGLTLIYTDFT